MSQTLTALETLAADFEEITVTLSPDDVAVFFYALGFLEDRDAWLTDDPLDDISDADWDTIEAMVASATGAIS